MKKIFFSLVITVISFLFFALNKDIPRILSGVDQITQPYIFNVARYLLWATMASTALTALLYCVSVRLAFLYIICSILFFVFLSFSIQALWINTYDMLPHMNLERALFNFGTLVFFLVLATKACTEKLGRFI
tara:strand:- start:4181 stop:4576 length:396 start_codon:yes stop_codon:yes gene_type:complete